ncbi:NADPH:quinone reductase-like Zn-dependent oxidoreductase [Paenibacillus sp. DS2015]|uniref:NAD(P)-dependent alcohol dehydrogenase n=1 Tax=Paenibacillus sp. DS2015 TaxID=3373917 RepID=UPI003D2280E8
MMQAAVIHKYGKSDIFQIETVPKPSPRSDEVQIRVINSSVNPIDFKTRSGSIFFLSGWKFPRILGGDFSGVVTQCGSQVNHLKAGDEVYGFSSAATKGGAYGAFMCCPASRVALKPDHLSHHQAASLPLAGLTAYQALHKEGNILPNMRVLITGATGGVGHFAVQIAKAAGCHVTGVCHSRNIELATTIGCDEVLPYDHSDFRQSGDQYDLIFDAVAKYGYYSCRKNLRPQGSYVSTVPSPSVMIMHVISKSSSRKRGRMVSANGNTADLEILSRLSNKGLLSPYIENVFPLSEIAKAHALSETEKVRGKIVIQVSQEPIVPR